MSNTQVATKRNDLKDILAKPEYQNRFREILGTRAPQFCSSLLSVARTMGDVEPMSVITAGMIAATLDLPVEKNLGFAWIVAYREGRDGPKIAQFQMGYKGYIQLAQRSGQYRAINAVAINEEAFVGYDKIGQPIIDWDKFDDTKPAAGYFVGWELVNGGITARYWPKKKVEAHAKRYSKSFAGGYDSPWKTHEDQMSLKTVIKNELSKWGILSVQMQKAIVHDDGAQLDIEGEVIYPDTEPKQLKAAKAPVSDGPQQTPTAPQSQQATEQKQQPGKTEPDKVQKGEEDFSPAGEKKPGEQTQPNENPLPVETEVEKRARVIKSLGEKMAESELTEEALIKFAKKMKIASANQSKITELATGKIEAIIKTWDNILPEIKKLSEKPA